MRWLLKLIRDIWTSSPVVRIDSSFDVEKSVERLSAATRRGSFFSPGKILETVAVGTVTRNRVSLHREMPDFGNAYKPIFTGKFVEENGRVVLEGRFAVQWATRVFMFIWFAIIFASTLLASVMALLAPKIGIVFVLTGLGMLLSGVGFLRWARNSCRNDPAWLSSVLVRALTDTDGAATRTRGTPD